MASNLHPLGLVGLSVVTYGAFLATLRRWNSGWDIKTSLEAVTDVHCVLSCSTVLFALSQVWPISLEAFYSTGSPNRLDDCKNPLIHGKSILGNAITAWEAGYLLYDTLAVALLDYRRVDSRGSIATAFTTYARKDPVIFFHHISLCTALLALQTYIAHGQERGVWIIVAFHLMNASTPLLHWRKRQKRATGSSSVGVDIAFAAAFATCRMGLIVWVVHKYGRYHDIGAWDAFGRQRWYCKLGTGSLFAMNSAWWLMLVKGMIVRFGRSRGVKR